MLKPKVVSETSISLADLKANLERIKARDTELNFRGQKTDEYLQIFANLSQSESHELKKKLDELQIPRLKEDIVIKLLDLLPANAEDLKVILQGYNLTLTADNLKKIIDVVEGYRK